MAGGKPRRRRISTSKIKTQDRIANSEKAKPKDPVKDTAPRSNTDSTKEINGTIHKELATNKKRPDWQKYSYIATCIIAVMSILGFAYTAKTSSQTSAVLKGLQDEVSSLMVPLITVDNVTVEPANLDHSMTKDNPPNMVIFNYKNASFVPVPNVQPKMPILLRFFPLEACHTKSLRSRG